MGSGRNGWKAAASAPFDGPTAYALSSAMPKIANNKDMASMKKAENQKHPGFCFLSKFPPLMPSFPSLSPRTRTPTRQAEKNRSESPVFIGVPIAEES